MSWFPRTLIRPVLIGAVALLVVLAVEWWALTAWHDRNGVLSGLLSAEVSAIHNDDLTQRMRAAGIDQMIFSESHVGAGQPVVRVKIEARRGARSFDIPSHRPMGDGAIGTFKLELVKTQHYPDGTVMASSSADHRAFSTTTVVAIIHDVADQALARLDEIEAAERTAQENEISWVK
jgi:hypothetical protein